MEFSETVPIVFFFFDKVRVYITFQNTKYNLSPNQPKTLLGQEVSREGQRGSAGTIQQSRNRHRPKGKKEKGERKPRTAKAASWRASIETPGVLKEGIEIAGNS